MSLWSFLSRFLVSGARDRNGAPRPASDPSPTCRLFVHKKRLWGEWQLTWDSIRVTSTACSHGKWISSLRRGNRKETTMHGLRSVGQGHPQIRNAAKMVVCICKYIRTYTHTCDRILICTWSGNYQQNSISTVFLTISFTHQMASLRDDSSPHRQPLIFRCECRIMEISPNIISQRE